MTVTLKRMSNFLVINIKFGSFSVVLKLLIGQLTHFGSWLNKYGMRGACVVLFIKWWCQLVDVTINKIFVFSTWLCNIQVFLHILRLKNPQHNQLFLQVQLAVGEVNLWDTWAISCRYYFSINLGQIFFCDNREMHAKLW